MLHLLKKKKKKRKITYERKKIKSNTYFVFSRCLTPACANETQMNGRTKKRSNFSIKVKESVLHTEDAWELCQNKNKGMSVLLTRFKGRTKQHPSSFFLFMIQFTEQQP